MSSAPRPTFLVDIGETLIHRAKPGPKRRVLDFLKELGIANEVLLQQAADAVLTATDPATAADVLSKSFGLSHLQRESMENLLGSSDGPAVVKPGAESFLRSARANGWRIVFATNAVGWASPVPASLWSREDTYVASSQYGLSKRTTGFWHQLCKEQALDVRFCVSLGDSIIADVEPALAVGLAAFHVSPKTMSLLDLARAVEGAGPMPDGCSGVVAGTAEDWRGHRVVQASNLAYLLERQTRRKARIGTRSNSWRIVVSRRRFAAPVFTTKAALPAVALGWLLVDEDRRATRVPAILERELNAVGLDVESIPRHLRRHAASLIAEASTDDIRRQRLHDIVASLLDGN